MSVFKFSAKSHLTRTCFFDDTTDIARYDKVKYPQFEKLTKQQLSYFWLPEKYDLGKDAKDFRYNLTPNEQFFSMANLKRQILLDSVQGRAPSLAFLPICSLPELENWIQTWTFFETIHSRSYTHILRTVYPDPSAVFDEMGTIPEIVACAEDISKYYDLLISHNKKSVSDGNIKDHKKALWLALNAVNFLEGIRFYVSFAVTWNFAEQGKLEGIAKIIKEICRDENLHLASTQHLLRLLPKEDSDFKALKEECKQEVLEMVSTIVNQEKTWTKFLFANGSIIGLNEYLLSEFVEERADKCLRNLGYEGLFGNKKNILPWTAKWISGSDIQVAPQETEISSYTVDAIRKDITETTFSDFTL